MMQLLVVLRFVEFKTILLTFPFLFVNFQFNPELVIVSAGFDSALGDEKVRVDTSFLILSSFIH